MAETPQHLGQNEMGCGFVGALFQRGSFIRPRSASAPPLPAIKNTSSIKHSSSSIIKKTKRRRASSGEMSYIDSSIVSAKPPPKLGKKPSPKSSLISPRPLGSSTSQIQGTKPPLNGLTEKSAKILGLDRVSHSQVTNVAYTRRLRKEPTFTESELSMRIAVRQKSTSSGVLYRASSGNAMLLGHLGNLKQPGGKNSTTSNIKTTMNYHATTVKRENSPISTPMLIGNIMRKPSGKGQQLGNIYRGCTPKNRLDPEVLKTMGNKNYKEGRFEDALVLYVQAIAQDPSKASYYSNKSAALVGLGRLMEAVFDCRVALRIDPTYQRAHQRLAKLYLRLGDGEKAMSHYKQSGPMVDAKEVSQAQALKKHISRINEARRLRDWETVEEESQKAISSAADSAPQIYATQAEALLKLRKHQEAYSTIRKGPNFDTNLCTQFFGAADCSNLLTIRAQVYMAAGRFEEAVTVAQRAAKLEPSNEANAVAKTARAMASARLDGNELFKASKFFEAFNVYSEGLQHEPLNSILLCNRAACLSKLGQYEKAVEDCSAALCVRPSYIKARLRRADCLSKLERWEATVQDYEILIKEIPEDEEIERALYVAQVHAKKQQSEDLKKMKNIGCSNLVMISSKEHFRRFVIAPGMSVVLFCNKTCHKQLLQLMEQVCLRFPSVNFLKVEIEDNPYILQLEDVNSVPAFKIYKNGSTIKEISGDNCQLLESSVKMISSSLSKQYNF